MAQDVVWVRDKDFSEGWLWFVCCDSMATAEALIKRMQEELDASESYYTGMKIAAKVVDADDVPVGAVKQELEVLTIELLQEFESLEDGLFNNDSFTFVQTSNNDDDD
jgi:hypothetical protein